MIEESKAEQDSPKKVRGDLLTRIDDLEIKINQITEAIIDSAHVMGWPKDVLQSHGLKPFDKRYDKLKIRQ